jgi:uncharacterized protein YjiS (DUF1127 family)
MNGQPFLLSLWATVSIWIHRWEERRSLSDLDDHLLRDLGLSRADVCREKGRPFWRGTERSLSGSNVPAWLSAAPDQAGLEALRENDKARRGCPSGSRNRPGWSAGTILGNNR